MPGRTVRISARKVIWPVVCPCCMGKADDEYELSHTRHTGKRVRRWQEWTFNIPYCSDCLDHQEIADEIRATNRYPYRYFVWAACLFLVTSCCVVPALADTPGPGDRGTRLLGLWVAAALVIFGLAGLPFFIQKHFVDRRVDRLRQDLRSCLRPKCICEDNPAVEFRDLHGSVLTLWFANPNYADHFERMNRGKVVR